MLSFCLDRSGTSEQLVFLGWLQCHYTMTHICLQLCVGKSRVLTTHYVLANVYLFNIKLSVGNMDVRLQVNCRRLSTSKKCVGKKF